MTQQQLEQVYQMRW